MTTGMSTRTEVCQIHGKDSQNFTLLKGKLPKGYMWSGWHWQSSSDYETRYCMALSAEQKWKSSPESRKTRMEKREAQTRQSSTTERYLLCWSRWPRRQGNLSKREEKVGNADGRTRKLGAELNASRFQRPSVVVWWNLMNPRGNEWDPLLKNRQYHVAGKRFTSMTHYDLVHKFFPMPQAMKILDAKAAVDKEWNKLEKTSVATGGSQSKKKVVLEVRRDTKKVHFATLMDVSHLKNAELEPKIAEVQWQSCAPGRYCKRRLWAYAVFTEQGSSASQMTGCYCKITRLWRTSSWCSICLHSS